MAKKKLRTAKKEAKVHRHTLRLHPSNSNATPIGMRHDRGRSDKEHQSYAIDAEIWRVREDIPDASGDRDLAHPLIISRPEKQELLPSFPSLSLEPNLIPLARSRLEKDERIAVNDKNAVAVTDRRIESDQETMNTNGSHPIHRHQIQPHQPKDRRSHLNDALPSSNGISHGPMPSHIQVAKPYVFHQAIEGCFNDLGVTQDREDKIRLAGVRWIDETRKALKLPVRTFNTAVVYYHKFRLSHADNEYSFVDAAAAALFAACKIEDTLKKSRDILCAAHNLKVVSRADHLSSDDPIFEHQSRAIIGLERLMLEASSFDFRNRHPQPLIIKLAKYYGYERHSAITKTAYSISLDLCRTFAPLKQTTATMAYACLELAGRLHGQEKEAIVVGRDYKRWDMERATVMETILDLLELYTHYNQSTTTGPEFSLDAFLHVRIPLNEELSTRRLPRYTEYIDPAKLGKKVDPAGYAIASRNGAVPSTNGLLSHARAKTSPTSPATPGTPGIRQKAGERGKEGTIRFMLNPDREREERSVVAEYGPPMVPKR